ncbi:SIPA1 protein, partial [Spizella passerina]|nr:SIPA1 protein [Spizella passerina]
NRGGVNSEQPPPLNNDGAGEESPLPQKCGAGVAAPCPLFSCACRDVLGWAFSEGRLEIFHGRGEWIGLRLPPGSAAQAVARLQ